MPPLETFAETLAGLLVETVLDPDCPGQLCLHAWNGHRVTTARKLEHRGVAYIPKQLAGGLVQSVRFAPPSASFGSTPKLVASLRDFLTTYGRLQPGVVVMLVAFAMATWFPDCMQVAPLLYLCGPDCEVRRVLRLLACICRRPVLIGDIDLGGLAQLPAGLGPTLLIGQRDLGRRVWQALLGSSRRHYCVARGSRRLDLYGARAFVCDDPQMDEPGIKVSLSPTQESPPVLTDAEERAIARSLQARLLRYRMLHYERVLVRRINCSAFVPEMRDQAHSWLAAICDCSELTNSVRQEIGRLSQEAAEVRFVDPRCVVSEAALFFCHKPDTQHFFVGELAETVNALLTGRHEESKLSAKQVGLLLRDLGVHGERVAQGYRVGLTDVVRERIHRLASDYRVLSVEDGVRRCDFCPEEVVGGTLIQ